MRTHALIILAALSLVGCGLKGPLYMPNPPADPYAPKAQAQESEEADTPRGSQPEAIDVFQAGEIAGAPQPSKTEEVKTP